MKSAIKDIQSTIPLITTKNKAQSEKLVVDAKRASIVSFDSYEDERDTHLCDRKEKVKYTRVIHNAKALWGKPVNDVVKAPWPVWEEVADEEAFIKNPTTKKFFALVEKSHDTMLTVGHQKYAWLDAIKVQREQEKEQQNNTPLLSEKKFLKLEKWHDKHQASFVKDEVKEQKRSDRRREKIERKGLGRTGKMSDVVAKAKSGSYYMKNNCTVRGNVFKLTHRACPKNLYEIMPRFGYRKGAHVGVRITQFGLSGLVTALGYALTPVTFGVSKYVSSHVSTVITLSGECITHKIAGAHNKKIATHASLRGLQLEIPRSIPIFGTVFEIAEGTAMGFASLGIASTTIAEFLLSRFSTRFTGTITADDLGDSRCLQELNRRIDYLSQFLLPYGQYLLLKETDEETKQELKKVLKEQFKLLRSLEKKKIESLHFYLLGLAAEKIPDPYREKIESHCRRALPEKHINTHRVVRTCLAQLLAKDAATAKQKTS